MDAQPTVLESTSFDTIAGHTNTGFISGTGGAGNDPDIIWTRVCVLGLSLAIGWEQASSNSKSLPASSAL